MKLQTGLYAAQIALIEAERKCGMPVPTHCFCAIEHAIIAAEHNETGGVNYEAACKDLDMCSEDGGVNNSAPLPAKDKEDPLSIGLRALNSEVDCRIEHGAESGGYLEYVRDRLDMILGQGGGR